MRTRHFEALTYSVKATIVAVVAVLGYKLFNLPGAAWVAAVSAVLVAQPDFHSSLKASLLRVAANLAGALGGAILLAVTKQPVLAMAIGVMATGIVCHLLEQDDAVRPAAVAVILVTLISGRNEWDSSFNRVIGVIIGCICALAVGFLFNKLTGTYKLPTEIKNRKSGHK